MGVKFLMGETVRAKPCVRADAFGVSGKLFQVREVRFSTEHLAYEYRLDRVYSGDDRPVRSSGNFWLAEHDIEPVARPTPDQKFKLGDEVWSVLPNASGFSGTITEVIRTEKADGIAFTYLVDGKTHSRRCWQHDIEYAGKDRVVHAARTLVKAYCEAPISSREQEQEIRQLVHQLEAALNSIQ